MRAFRELLSIFGVCTSLPFGFKGGMLDLILLISDHSFTFSVGRNIFYGDINNSIKS